MSEPIRFFLPGPTYVREAVRARLTAEMVAHRSEAFGRLYRAVTERLRPIFRTEGEVLVATSSATLLMQAALQSTVGRRALHLVNGAFSGRWGEIGRSLGLESDRVEVPWGEAVDPDLLRQALRRRGYDAVTLAHSETSTGVLNPLEDLSRVVHEESDALILVDAVSSLAGAPVEVDEWELDVVLTASQKALALPPGLAFVSFSERAATRAERVERRGFYTDLLRYRDKHRAGGTIATPAVSLFRAADLQLARILEEGIERRWRRHRECLDRIAAWAGERGRAFLPDDHRSPTVSCLRPPAGVAAPSVVAGAAARGYTIGGGYGRLEPETFRIGHMGEVTPDDVDSLLGCLDEVMAQAAATAAG
jgi:predicted phosphoserine aminotransferase